MAWVKGPDGEKVWVDKRKDPRQADHLKPWHWKPGQSGNPKGPPKGKPISLLGILRKALEKVVNEKTGETVADQVIQALLVKSRKGSAQHIHEVFDRIHGKPKETVEYSEKSRMPGVSDEDLARKLSSRGVQGPDGGPLDPAPVDPPPPAAPKPPVNRRRRTSRDDG